MVVHGDSRWTIYFIYVSGEVYYFKLNFYHFPVKLRPCSFKNTWIVLVFIFLMEVMWGFNFDISQK